MNKCIVITGQTATGKTSYALKLAKERGGDIINFDSRQMYRHLDIITGKDIESKNFVTIKKITLPDVGDAIIGYYTVQDVKVWLYDAVDPKQYFSSFDFKTLAHELLSSCLDDKTIPIFVGGSYLYIKHLLYGFDSETIPPNWELRNELNHMAVSDLQKKLKNTSRIQFEAMNNSDRQNPRRLIRKIEISISRSTPGVTNRSLIKSKSTPGVTISKFIGFRYKEIDTLAMIIRKRVRERLEMGAIEEVKALLQQGYTSFDPGLNTIGYKEVIEFLEGKLTKQEMIERWVLSEVQYAKRQYTFMKKDANIVWKVI